MIEIKKFLWIIFGFDYPVAHFICLLRLVDWVGEARVRIPGMADSEIIALGVERWLMTQGPVNVRSGLHCGCRSIISE